MDLNLSFRKIPELQGLTDHQRNSIIKAYRWKSFWSRLTLAGLMAWFVIGTASFFVLSNYPIVTSPWLLWWLVNGGLAGMANGIGAVVFLRFWYVALRKCVRADMNIPNPPHGHPEPRPSRWQRS